MQGCDYKMADNQTSINHEGRISVLENKLEDFISFSKENLLITPNGNRVYEVNNLLAGRNKEHIDNYFDFMKEVNRPRNKKINKTIDKAIYYYIMFSQLNAIIQNNKISKIAGLPQIWTIAYSWQF